MLRNAIRDIFCEILKWPLKTRPQGSNRRGKSGGLAWRQGKQEEKITTVYEKLVSLFTVLFCFCFVTEFPKTKRRKYPNILCVIIRNSNWPFIPANDYNEMKLTIIVRWNEWPVRFEHNYTSSFRSILWDFCHLGFFPTYRLVFMLKPPDFPRLFEPREGCVVSYTLHIIIGFLNIHGVYMVFSIYIYVCI